MAGIKLDFGFERTADEPIDASQTLSKAEMLAMDDSKMPNVYFAVCKDDKKMYVYDKSATPNAETGKFSVYGGGGETPDLNAVLTKGNTTSKDVNISGKIGAEAASNRIHPQGYTVSKADDTSTSGGGGSRTTSIGSGAMTLYGTYVKNGNIVDEKDFSFGYSVNRGEEKLTARVQMDDEMKQAWRGTLNIKDIPNGGTTGQVLTKKSNADGDVEWADGGGSGSGNADFTLDTANNFAVIQSQTQGMSFDLSDADGVTVIASEPGTYQNTKKLATQDYVDSKAGVEAAIIDVDNFSMTKNEFVQLFFTDKLLYIRDGGKNHLVNGKYNWTLLPEEEYELSYLEGNTIITHQFEVSDDVYYRGKDRKSAGVDIAVGKEKWYGTYTDENNVTYQTYTKTIFIPALPSTAGITTYPIGVTNMKQIISISGVTTDGFVLNAPRQTVTDNITIYQTSKGSQTFSIEVGKDRSNKSAYVTIIYAKNN